MPCKEASLRSWLIVACIDSTVLVMEVRPLSAASSVLMPLDMASSRLDGSDARDDSDDEVKKFVGLSRAELTFLPVARRFWVRDWRAAVFCRANRFWRTPAERVILEAIVLNLSGLVAVLARWPYWPLHTCRPFRPAPPTSQGGRNQV